MMSLETVADQNKPGRLGELYAAHVANAGRFAYLLVGDAELADDIVQEAFVRVAGRLGSLRKPESFSFYLRRTIINLVKGHIRQAVKEREIVSKIGPSQESVDAVDLSERDVILRALYRLPPRQRAAVVLRYYEDLSEHQVAELLDCPLGTVKSLVFRALSSLRKELGEHD